MKHQVTPGDTLWTLSRSHGCDIETLRKVNKLDGDALRIGQTIKIPQCQKQSPKPEPRRVARTVHVVQPGQTLSHIAQLYDVSVPALQASNDIVGTNIVAGQQLRVASAAAPRERMISAVVGQSIGRPQRGKLVGGVQLPDDGAYYRRRPERAYGATHVVEHIRRVVAEVQRKHPRVHRLAIGDLSRPTGGRLSGHSSHQSGRDVDLGLYFKRPPANYPQEFVNAQDGVFDRAATWALLQGLWQASRLPGGPQQVFLDYGVQQMLYEYAQVAGVPAAELGRIFQYPDGVYARERFVAHEPYHADHFHVRFACPPEDVLCR